MKGQHDPHADRLRPSCQGKHNGKRQHGQETCNMVHHFRFFHHLRYKSTKKAWLNQQNSLFLHFETKENNEKAAICPYSGPICRHIGLGSRRRQSQGITNGILHQ
jgi:hypothetical protein